MKVELLSTVIHGMKKEVPCPACGKDVPFEVALEEVIPQACLLDEIGFKSVIHIIHTFLSAMAEHTSTCDKCRSMKLDEVAKPLADKLRALTSEIEVVDATIQAQVAGHTNTH